MCTTLLTSLQEKATVNMWHTAMSLAQMIRQHIWSETIFHTGRTWSCCRSTLAASTNSTQGLWNASFLTSACSFLLEEMELGFRTRSICVNAPSGRLARPGAVTRLGLWLHDMQTRCCTPHSYRLQSVVELALLSLVIGLDTDLEDFSGQEGMQVMQIVTLWCTFGIKYQ